ncbi:hypothetical protein DIZ27_03280 [Streptomyces sp. NWU339]|nr:hypothetical protein DIZ27_03280 [Streptomyces sp. NWU339]
MAGAEDDHLTDSRNALRRGQRLVQRGRLPRPRPAVTEPPPTAPPCGRRSARIVPGALHTLPKA